MHRPNFALVIMDAARVDAFSCYGYGRSTTPCIDALAAESVLFENAFAVAPWTLPSHASMFTGNYPSWHGTNARQRRLRADCTTLAEFLTTQGYETRAYSSNAWVSHATGLDRGFQHFERIGFRAPGSAGQRLGRVIRRLAAKVAGQEDKGARSIVRSVRNWLDQRDPGRPFFLFINFSEVHVPYRVPRAYRWRFLPPNQEIPRVVFDPKLASMHFVDPSILSPDHLDILRGCYDSSLLYLDSQVGELCAALRAVGVLDDTMLILTADHGELLGEHGQVGHMLSLNDLLLHLPLIVRYPARFPPGTRSDDLVEIVDFFPTIREILGENSPALTDQCSGYTMTKTARGEAVREFVVAEDLGPDVEVFRRRHPDFDISPYDRDLQTIRTERLKYVRGSDGSEWLYDLSADPAEENNVVLQYAPEAEALCQRLREWQSTLGNMRDRTQAEDVEFDQEVVERLRALGYLG